MLVRVYQSAQHRLPEGGGSPSTMLVPVYQSAQHHIPEGGGGSSRMLVPLHWSTHHHFPEDVNLYQHLCVNVRSYKLTTVDRECYLGPLELP
jgi:hypothetical protein